MHPRILGTVVLFPFLGLWLGPSSANADELVTPPSAKAPPSASGLPDEIEGFHLGEPLADLRARLEVDGWMLRERARERRGVPILQVSAKHRSNALLRKLRLHFVQGRLVGVKAYYRRKDPSRAAHFARTCADLESVGVGGFRKGCVDAARTRIFEYRPDGRRVELIDLATGLRLGIITRAKLEHRLRRAKGPLTPEAPARAPAPPATPSP